MTQYILLAFVSYFGFEIEQMDVPDAYPIGDLKEVIYTEVPQGYDSLGHSKVRY